MLRPSPSDVQYLLHPENWQADRWNNTINTGFDHGYTYGRGEGKININLRSSTFFSDYDYSQLSLTAVNNNYLGKLDFRTRVFAQFGTGTSPLESMVYLAGANPEQLSEDKFTRARGIVPTSMVEYGTSTNHFHYGGGLNLRGYAGYWGAEQEPNGDVGKHYAANSGAAVNAELGLGRALGLSKPFIKNTFKFDTYLFADAGTLDKGYNTRGKLFLIQPRIDAGLGTALTIQRWGPLQMVNPLTIRFDMPVFLNRPPAAEPEYLKFRWVLGIKRAF
jgi:aminopeptidase N